MACSSASSIPKSFKYDVFLSFRGEDTRTNFVDHLYHQLQQKNIYTYKDDERIKKGKRISDELIGSIEDSKFYIVVFSKNYASSSWCLDELVKIMECHRTTEHTAYPVFYDVEPSEVRKQNRAVAEAFAKHEKEEAAGKWREAMKEAADLAGWELKNTVNGHEAQFIKKIVEELSVELRSTYFSIDKKLVGMESRINDVLSYLRNGYDDVRMIGIKGMGGGGKTTLARAVFDHISFQFEGRSFVENVREVSSATLCGLKSLQNQVLFDVFNDKNISVSSVDDGKYMMKKMMPNRKVLVVLDDVDHIDQLEALAGEPNWFKPGSRVIVTTRDEQVLVAHRVKLIRNVNLLSDMEAICLFNKYAFGRNIPSKHYEELSKQVVHYAAGLPLTIRVLGSFLCGKSELEWVDYLERLKTIPLAETLKKLELSYNGLEEDYKEIFLDIACILKGWKKDNAIKALESCGLHARNGLRVLENKSLITTYYDYNHNKFVGMHDHIQEMGRNIVRRSHPDKPHKHSRLWIDDEIEDILANDLGTKATRCTRVYAKKLNPHIVVKCFGKMKKLIFLSVVEDCFCNLEINNISIPDFPNGLRYLCINCYPFRSLPKTFQANNLVSLEMPNSGIVQLWEEGENKVLNKLRFLNLSWSMLSTLDLGLTPNLETLNLGQCHNLVEFHMPVACLKLISIDLSHSRLKTLNLGMAPNLETVILVQCNDLVELHMPSRYPNLRSLQLANLKLRTLYIELIPVLKELNLGGCNHLEELHIADECQKLTNLNISHSKVRTLNLGLTPNLEKLDLVECCNLVELHMPYGCLYLGSLRLTNSKLRTLDIGLTPNLKNLDLKNNYDLEAIHMSAGCLKLVSFDLSHSRLRTLDLALAPNLEMLILDQCIDLLELHMPSRCLNLRSLQLTNSKLRTLDIGLTPVLQNLDLENCYDLEEFHMADECQNLTNLKISHSKLKTFNLGLTPNLKKLDLVKCYNLVELPTPPGCLKKIAHLYISCGMGFRSFLFQTMDYSYSTCSVDESLEVGPVAELHLIVVPLKSCPLHPNHSLPKFRFSFIYKEDRPSLTTNLEMLISVVKCACTSLEAISGSICGLRRLRKLTLEGSIMEAPKDLDQLERLEELMLLSIRIDHLPGSIFMLKHLKSLEINSCLCLEKLPKDLGRLESLEKLTLLSIKIKHLPDSICMLKHLKSLELNSCFLLEKLPEDLGRLECLENLTLSSTMIQHLPDSICMLKNLKSLELNPCFLLEKLPEDFGQLESLENLTLYSTTIKNLPDSICMLKHLKSLELNSCFLLMKLPEDLGRLECLEKFTLYSTTIQHLPDSICMLKRLKSLELNSCFLLMKLPDNLGRLECLEKLTLISIKIKHLPDSICMLKHLKSLELNHCSLLEKLPVDIGQLKSLKKLNVMNCERLQDIPNSIGEMLYLEQINLSYCTRVEKLPEELGLIEYLKELLIEGTSISHIPQSMLLLKRLRILDRKGKY